MIFGKRLPVYIPFDRYRGIGGPSTFMRNFEKFLARRRLQPLPRPDNARLLFFAIEADPALIARVVSAGGRIVQRLDGIFYFEKHGPLFDERNAPIRQIYTSWADFVVFQSRYSLEQCFSKFGEKPASCYDIIINGVDKKIFYPARRRIRAKRWRLVTTGRFRNADMIVPLVRACDSLRGKLDLELRVVGPVVDPGSEAYLARDYVKHIGSADPAAVARILRDSDIFVYSHLNPPCPNSVIEAVSCGLPVVGFDSGAMKEIVPFGTELLAGMPGGLFQKYEDLDAGKLADKIFLAADDFARVAARAAGHSSMYPFDECGQKYLDVFDKVMSGKGREGI